MRYLFVAFVGIAAFTLSAWAAPALARANDAHREVTLSQAEALASEYREFVYFCQECGDAVPGIPFAAEGAITALARGGGTVVLVVNGREFPVQHVYVRTEPEWFRNVAVLLDLPVGDNSPSLRVEKVGSSGELITAHVDREPTDVNVDPRATALLAAAQTPPSADVRTPCGFPTEALALAAFAFSASASLAMFWFVWAARRRRHRAVLPRALHLRK